MSATGKLGERTKGYRRHVAGRNKSARRKTEKIITEKRTKEKYVELTVAAAMFRDQGLKRVPLIPKIQKQLNVKIGDIVKIDFGGKAEYTTVVDGYLRDKMGNYVRLDKSVRNRLGADIGERVRVSKPLICEAARVLLKVVVQIPHFNLNHEDVPVLLDDRMKARLHQDLVNKYLIEGTTFSVPSLGYGIHITVLKTHPKSVVVRVTEKTEVTSPHP